MQFRSRSFKGRAGAMRRVALTAMLGTAALLGSASTWAWMDLHYYTNVPATGNVVLRCEANHDNACTGPAGTQSSHWTAHYNPLDGSSVSKYRLTLEGSVDVLITMVDQHTACSLAQPNPWKNGWKWLTQWKGPDGVTHEKEVCTTAGDSGDPWIAMHVMRLSAPSQLPHYFIELNTDFDTDKTYARPGATFSLDMTDRVLLPLP